MITDLKVYCVIVTFNGANWIKKCLSSLNESSVETQIIVVDNASSDTTVEIVQSEFPEAHLLRQPENMGFGQANNMGISQALKSGADYVFLLNQDARVGKACLESLVSFSQQNTNFGILSSIHLDWEGQFMEFYFERFAAKQQIFLNDHVLKRSIKSVYEVPFVNAAAWLVPRIVFETVGGFDPIFFHYGEDNNFAQRVRYHDFKIGLLPEVVIYHDSPKRKLKYGEMFDEEYYRIETNQFKLKYGNILKDYDALGIKNELSKIKTRILMNASKLNGFKVRGYIKKYRLYNNAIQQIELSRQTNVLKAPNYLDI